jgi:prepilin peptidase CpaA
MSVAFSFAMLVLLAVAAWHDVATRTIPDSVSLILIGIGMLVRVPAGPAGLSLSVATALVLFLLLLIAYSRGLLGGGDVKVMSALAVGLAPLDVYRFVIATALAGGFLGISYLLLSRRFVARKSPASNSLLRRVTAVEAWRIRKRGPLPYGVAIAVGGAFVLLHPGGF